MNNNFRKNLDGDVLLGDYNYSEDVRAWEKENGSRLCKESVIKSFYRCSIFGNKRKEVKK